MNRSAEQEEEHHGSSTRSAAAEEWRCRRSDFKGGGGISCVCDIMLANTKAEPGRERGINQEITGN